MRQAIACFFSLLFSTLFLTGSGGAQASEDAAWTKLVAAANEEGEIVIIVPPSSTHRDFLARMAESLFQDQIVANLRRAWSAIRAAVARARRREISLGPRFYRLRQRLPAPRRRDARSDQAGIRLGRCEKFGDLGRLGRSLRRYRRHLRLHFAHLPQDAVLQREAALARQGEERRHEDLPGSRLEEESDLGRSGFRRQRPHLRAGHAPPPWRRRPAPIRQ